MSEPKAKIWQVIAASAVGTMIEWYDFYIFGSLATVISPLFYPKGDDTLALIAYLSTFAVGFVVRPFGALFFGRIGDLVGRKYAFLVTLLIMGGATALIGFLPTYATIGMMAPAALLLIRVLQGLALGGEYGGAAVYVAEHVPDERRGFYTSFIQITATLGLFLSLAVILAVQNAMSREDFAAWGWRVPFILSIGLVGISLYIRLRMRESPIFEHIKSTGMTSARPLAEAFTQWENLRRVLISLFGATAGQGVVWYTGQFYALFYMQTILKVNATSANYIVATALLLGMPFFVVFGALSDRIGRKRIMMLGCILAALSYVPIYQAMQAAAGSNVVAAASQKNPVTGAIVLTPLAEIDGSLQPASEVLTYEGLRSLARQPAAWKLVLLVFVQVIFVTMVYGPIAAYLVEAFPAKIRYTALSLPYHIGNGVFGGLLPVFGLWVVSATGDILAGLYYPITVATLTFVVGSLLLTESNHVKIWTEVEKMIDLQETFEKLVGRYFLYAHQWLFETTDGRVSWLGGMPVLLLRTVGSKSGAERTAALVYLQDGDDLVIVASNGGSDRAPSWLGNLKKTPAVGVQIGRERRRMHARIADQTERARLWPRVNEMNAGRYDAYQSRTEREIPLVILSAEPPKPA